MNEENITIEFKYPWTMLPLENADEWITAVKNSLRPNEPLYRKEIFVSGRHEYEQLMLVENDTDGNYAIVSVEYGKANTSITCKTVVIFDSRKALAEKLRNDNIDELARFKENQG